jgi:hypothetical protein
MLSIVSCLCNYAKIKQINEREKEKSRVIEPGVAYGRPRGRRG